jgi:Flp pilus assembly protein protease CpaA
MRISSATIQHLLNHPRGKLFLSVILFVLGFIGAALLNSVSLHNLQPKDLIGCLTVALSVCGLGHFIFDALWGKSRPHIYSWLIWTIVNSIAWYNQWTHNAGPGAWSTLMMTVLSGIIFGIALYQHFAKQSEHQLTTMDQWCLGGAIISIVFLIIFKAGPISIIAATATDVFAFAPTLKKVWRHPQSEPASNYTLNTIRQSIVISAIGSYNFVTVVFPVTLIFFNGLTVATILLQRKKVALATQTPALESD